MVREKELLSIIFAINKFNHYITSYPTFEHMDHMTITYLANRPTINAQVMRWVVLMHELDIKIVHKHRKENIVSNI